MPIKTIVEPLEKSVKNKGDGKVEMPLKPGIRTVPDAFIHAMSAYIPAMRSASIK